MELAEKDLRVEVFDVTGDAAPSVRVEHLPTGRYAWASTESTWRQNKAKALAVLIAALAEAETS